MAISLIDTVIAARFPNSKIIQKAFGRDSDSFTIKQYSSIWFKQKQRNWSHTSSIFVLEGELSYEAFLQARICSIENSVPKTL